MILSRFNYQEKLQIKKEKEKQEIDFDFFMLVTELFW